MGGGCRQPEGVGLRGGRRAARDGQQQGTEATEAAEAWTGARRGGLGVPSRRWVGRLIDVGRGSPAASATRGAGAEAAAASTLPRSLPSPPARSPARSSVRPPHLQDPDPSWPAARRRFGRLRGLQRARGPRVHLPHRRPRLHRDAGPARRRAEPRRRARAAGGPAPRGPPAPPLRRLASPAPPAASPDPPLPQPRWTCVAAGAEWPGRRQAASQPRPAWHNLAPPQGAGPPLPAALGLED